MIDRRRRAWLLWLPIAALHLALLLTLQPHAPARSAAPRVLTAVRLVPAPRRPPPASPAIAAPRLTAPAVTVPLPPAFDTEAAASPTVEPPAAPISPAEPPRLTLRLTLPPGYAASAAAARNPALSDPRSNTPRRTLEDRIADAAGNTGPWTEERTSDHRTVMRRGDTCVEVFRSRIADMDPFNGNVAPRTAGMLGKPYKCK